MIDEQTKAAQVDVGPLDDFPDERPVVVKVRGADVVIVRCGDEVFALKNICPHQSASFEGGQVGYHLSEGEQVGELVVHKDEPELACPWHGWTFGLRDGRCTVDPRLRVKAYAASIRDGRVVVSDQ
jgi:3-phenylpropionate/trans-cinnamate dioxygenase ferredoxin subunit